MKQKKNHTYRSSFQAKTAFIKIDLTNFSLSYFFSYQVISLWPSVLELLFCGFVTLALDYEHLRLGTGTEEHVGFCAAFAIKHHAQRVTSNNNSSVLLFSKAQLINERVK